MNTSKHRCFDKEDEDVKEIAKVSGASPEVAADKAEAVLRAQQPDAKPYDGCIDEEHVKAFKTSKFAAGISTDGSTYTIHIHYAERGVQLLEVADPGIAHITFAIFDDRIDLDPACYATLGDALEKCWLAYKATCSRGRFVYIHNLQVREGLRGKGRGRRLVEFVLKTFLRPQNAYREFFVADSIFLCANARDFHPGTGARLYRFYESLGFKRLASSCAVMYHDPGLDPDDPNVALLDQRAKDV